MFAFERSRYGLSENGIAYYAMTYFLRFEAEELC